jgi:hypothetical protein
MIVNNKWGCFTPNFTHNTQRRYPMILNYKQLMDHNKSFYDAFVDLKVVGWKSYSAAMNAYTMNFFKDQLSTMDDAVEKTGKMMKGDFA